MGNKIIMKSEMTGIEIVEMDETATVWLKIGMSDQPHSHHHEFGYEEMEMFRHLKSVMMGMQYQEMDEVLNERLKIVLYELELRLDEELILGIFMMKIVIRIIILMIILEVTMMETTTNLQVPVTDLTQVKIIFLAEYSKLSYSQVILCNLNLFSHSPSNSCFSNVWSKPHCYVETGQHAPTCSLFSHAHSLFPSNCNCYFQSFVSFKSSEQVLC